MVEHSLCTFLITTVDTSPQSFYYETHSKAEDMEGRNTGPTFYPVIYGFEKR